MAHANVLQVTEGSFARKNVTQVTLDPTVNINVNAKEMPRVIMSMVVACVIQGFMGQTVNISARLIQLGSIASSHAFVTTEEFVTRQLLNVPVPLGTRENYVNFPVIMDITDLVVFINACARKTQFVIKKQENASATQVSMGDIVISSVLLGNTD